MCDPGREDEQAYCIDILTERQTRYFWDKLPDPMEYFQTIVNIADCCICVLENNYQGATFMLHWGNKGGDTKFTAHAFLTKDEASEIGKNYSLRTHSNGVG